MPDFEARFVHTNLIAEDWVKLAEFYERVFGCTPLPPERDLSGVWLEVASGVPGARLRGVHLRLPGYGNGGPTLELFHYDPQLDGMPAAPNRPGFGHIAFAVADVEVALQKIIQAGGGQLGEIVTVCVPDAGMITFVYATDPEGNIIELQHWQG